MKFEEELNNVYVYRHRRLDTNKIFYVGISKTKNFKRAYSKNNRNIHWKRIVNKTDYNVEILKSNLIGYLINLKL